MATRYEVIVVGAGRRLRSRARAPAGPEGGGSDEFGLDRSDVVQSGDQGIAKGIWFAKSMRSAGLWAR